MLDVCTPRLRLRAPGNADAADLARLMAPRISARLASWPPFMVPGTARMRVEQATEARAAGAALPLVITRRSDGTVMGWVAASRADADPSRALVTYWLGEAFQGQGYMREAARPALAEAFRVLGVNEVRAAVQPDNQASRAVLAGMGMRFLTHGRIWCSARAREEVCEWWAIERPSPAMPLSTLAFANAPPGTIPMAAAAQ